MTVLGSVLAILAGLAACEPETAPASIDKPRLGLLTSLPLYWNEAGELGEMVSDQAGPPWQRTVLERHFDIVPLDSLAGGEGVASVDAVLLAQPRALSAEENVALDNWVRAGGRALVFADPLLTGHSRFPIGDRRRPQDVVLLSPILARWGLELTFDPEQQEGERLIEAGELSIPANLSGRFRLVDGAASCSLAGDGLVAECNIGTGRATIIADAALVEGQHGELSAARQDVLSALAMRLARHAGQGGD